SAAGYARSVAVVEAKPGGEAKWEEIFLSSGKPVVKWKEQGLSVVHGWVDEGRDRNALIDHDIHLTVQLSLEENHRLR
ncbi:UNVERIFIED_CONTAM: exonuclease sbcCD subunit D, partial [Bacillus amyloliquefaciens DSM 7 = ATCC 23350]